jgi:hypothetical protein
MLRDEFDALVRLAAAHVGKPDWAAWDAAPGIRRESKAAAAIYVSRTFDRANQRLWESAAERAVAGASTDEGFLATVQASGFDMSKFRSHLGFKQRHVPA